MTQWQTLIKPAVLFDIMKLPNKEMQQVQEKITMLTQDPRPDNKVKKQLVHLPGKPYRIRSGRYRIFYTFNKQTVLIYKVAKRDESIYRAEDAPDNVPSTDELNELELDMEDAATTASPRSDWEHSYTKAPTASLPEPITIDMLKKLRVNEAYYPRLLRITDEEGLINCSGVDQETMSNIMDYLYSRPLIEVIEQPDLILNDVDDLLRYKEGELLNFLLKLSPEQEQYANWSLTTKGPTLVKGGPGTGKSTVALYRVRSLLDQLLKRGKSAPSILFTTYTHALVKSSQQLLNQLLGADAQYVRVDTADSVAYQVLNSCGMAKLPALFTNTHELQALTREAVDTTSFQGNSLQVQVQQQIIERMGLEYLLQEFNSVIIGRQITTLEAYQKVSRAGRKLRLSATHRTAVWNVYQRWCQLLQQAEKETWQQRRARAERLTRKSLLYQAYDAVVIDEAQDLDPSALRMLIQVCKTPGRLFVTADANQAIYGSSFSWSDIHQDLRFQGRTSILKANYRSTFEIGEAAQSYLDYGILEPEVSERHYINNGPMPDARTVLNSSYEVKLLKNFFTKASLSLRLALGSCAILCPSETVGRSLAVALNNIGTEATYMSGHDLDLAHSGVKIITLKSSKGLEFPIVALAGFTSSNYPAIPAEASTEEADETLTRERRTLFVGMTRAMRALLVVIPHEASSPLLQGFDATYWNFSRTI
ncbi:DNA helicase [Ktedonobacteria bacterium brp13]|nr:DNA helicase [Ktedonobacteria bacterium brp13]